MDSTARRTSGRVVKKPETYTESVKPQANTSAKRKHPQIAGGGNDDIVEEASESSSVEDQEEESEPDEEEVKDKRRKSRGAKSRAAAPAKKAKAATNGIASSLAIRPISEANGKKTGGKAPKAKRAKFRQSAIDDAEGLYGMNSSGFYGGRHELILI